MTEVNTQTNNLMMHDIINALYLLKTQLNLIKQGKEPTLEIFCSATGVCDNLMTIIDRDVLNNTSTIMASKFVNTAIMHIVRTHTDIFSSIHSFPIKDPTGQLNPLEFYKRSGNKYTCDVIDDRIKLIELIDEFCKSNIV